MSSLYRRLALVLLGVFLLLASLLFWLYESSSKHLQLETSQKLHLHLAEYLVQDIKLFTHDELDLKRVKEAFNKVMHLDPATELYIIDQNGKVLAYDAPDEKIKQHHVNLLPIKQFLKYPDELPIVGDDPRSTQQKVFSVAPIYKNAHDLSHDKTRLAGYLYIIIGGERYDSVASSLKENKTWRHGLFLMGIALVFLLLTTLLLFYGMTRPLVRLSREVAEFEQSGFSQLPKNSDHLLAMDTTKLDEMQQLQGSFYRMSQHIQQQLDYLKKHDRLRREFLAHVSHDLRTPLAGMRAYLETLQLKGEALKASDRQTFIEKALRSNTRISAMLNELFELARLEHGQINIHPETLRLSDLLSDTYASLSTMALTKGITLNVKMTQQNITVYADIERLDRILQNLIVNAIHYTPKHGSVTIGVTQTIKDNEQWVTISIKDTGLGISTEELPYIFEPYFRANNGEKIFREGQGLGLAITQRLLKLHNSAIKVSSELHQGTTFSFTLRGSDPINQSKGL